MKFWTSDGRLDVVVLGPMSANDDEGDVQLSGNCEVIKDVADAVLAEPQMRQLLAASGVISAEVTCPEGFRGSDIRSNVLMAIDKADIALFDISPRPGERSPSPNVMYELGLVHALGLPYLMIQKRTAITPFYLTQLKCIDLPAAKYPNPVRLAKRLREELEHMLRPDDQAHYETNPISQYYDNAAVVDISAVMGLATGYYFNFLYRLLKDPNFLHYHTPRQIDHQVTLVPNSLRSSVRKDIEDFQVLVERAGLKVESFKLELPQGWPADIREVLSKRIGRIGFDIPSTAYALRRSPRYSTLAAKTPGASSPELVRMEQGMLNRFGTATSYLLQRGLQLEDMDISRHSLERIPTTVDEVHRIFGNP